MTISATPLPRPAALHEQTYQAWRKSIISGDLEPGDRAWAVRSRCCRC